MREVVTKSTTLLNLVILFISLWLPFEAFGGEEGHLKIISRLETAYQQFSKNPGKVSPDTLLVISSYIALEYAASNVYSFDTNDEYRQSSFLTYCRTTDCKKALNWIEEFILSEEYYEQLLQNFGELWNDDLRFLFGFIGNESKLLGARYSMLYKSAPVHFGFLYRATKRFDFSQVGGELFVEMVSSMNVRGPIPHQLHSGQMVRFLNILNQDNPSEGFVKAALTAAILHAKKTDKYRWVGVEDRTVDLLERDFDIRNPEVQLQILRYSLANETEAHLKRLSRNNLTLEALIASIFHKKLPEHEVFRELILEGFTANSLVGQIFTNYIESLKDQIYQSFAQRRNRRNEQLNPRNDFLRLGETFYRFFQETKSGHPLNQSMLEIYAEMTNKKIVENKRYHFEKADILRWNVGLAAVKARASELGLDVDKTFETLTCGAAVTEVMAQ